MASSLHLFVLRSTANARINRIKSAKAKECSKFVRYLYSTSIKSLRKEVAEDVEVPVIALG